MMPSFLGRSSTTPICEEVLSVLDPRAGATTARVRDRLSALFPRGEPKLSFGSVLDAAERGNRRRADAGQRIHALVE